MGGKRPYKARDYAVGQQLLTLRTRAELRQAELAALLQVSQRTIHNWENGEAYPREVHLRHLLALAQERGLLTPGREQQEAAQLWALVGQHTARRLGPFDPAWFASLPRPATALPAEVARRVDWGEAPAARSFHGREPELATLRTWFGSAEVRLVALLGMGGIGKTSLAARLARELAPTFAAVYWRSLRNAPPVETWLAGAIAALSAGQAAPPEGFAARLRLLLDLLRERRSLLILDNLETVLEPGTLELSYRAGYAGYGELLQQLAASGHQSCLLLTSREKPPELVAIGAASRSLQIGGLSVDEARALLAPKQLIGTSEQWAELVTRFAGNGLALQLVGEGIYELFGGDLGSFLQEGGTSSVFGGMRRLLDEQVERSSVPEQLVLRMLAVEREPVCMTDMLAILGPRIGRGAVVAAVEALRRRSLVERAKTAGAAALTLQSAVLEYMTDQLVATAADEIVRGQPRLLIEQPLIQARAKEYVRQAQERLIGGPIVQLLRAEGGAGRAEQQLLALLEGWRGRPSAEQGYGPGNVVNLLRLLQDNLRGLDLARLTLRQTYLAGVEAQDASLAYAHLVEPVLTEAFSIPTAVALSSDGALLVAGTSTGELWLWRVADRALLLVIQGHTGVVMGLALSADGRRVLSSGGDGAVKLWEGESGRLLATLDGHSGAVRAVALSADGQLLASSGGDGAVKLWEGESGRLLATLDGHSGAVRAVALSADGQLLASGGDGTLRLWEGESGRLLATLDGHSGAVRAVALSADGQLLASGGGDGTLRLWEGESGRLLATLDGHSGAVRAVALSADGQLLASGGDGTLRLWETSSGRLLATIEGHSGAVLAMALSGDGQLLASGGGDGTLRLWETSSGRLLATLPGYSGGVRTVALSADGQLLASGGGDGTLRLWETSGGRLLATLPGHSGGVWAVTLSGDGQLLASGGGDGTLRLWETPGGRPLAALAGHSGGVRTVALSGDGQLLASGGGDGTLRLWETFSGRPLATLAGHSGGVRAVTLSGDGQLLASGGGDGTLRLWETSSGRLLTTLRAHMGAGILGVALSGDGQLLASGDCDGTLRLWETSSGRPLATLQAHAGGACALALSRDGQLLASGGGDGTVTLWAVPGGTQLATLQAHAGGACALALSRDGQLLASGGGDGTVTLWAVPGGTQLATLRPERCYDRLDITGLEGLTEVQRTMLRTLGAIEKTSSP